MCFDGQQSTGTKLIGKVTPRECEDRCSAQQSCIGYASHFGNICYIVSDDETISPWTSQTHLSYTCYEKIVSPSYEQMWQGLCYEGQQKRGNPRFITPEACKHECSARSLCIGYASHPANICFITSDHETISSWTTQTYMSYTCYKKD